MGNRTDRRVVMLANGHSPFDTRIFIKEAKTLAALGFQVSIIVPHDRDENREGINIVSVTLHRRGWKKLVANPINILRKALRQPSSSVFHIHDSDILVTGIILKIFGRKVIYDAHEDTPLQISYQHWIPDILKKPYALFYYLLEKICGWWFDAIIVAEPVIAKYFPQKKTFLVRNFPIVKPFADYPSSPYKDREKTLIYIGTLSKVRGLFEMIEGVKIAKKNAHFEFVLGGEFAPRKLEDEIKENPDVRFLGWISFNRLIELLFQARAGIIIPNPVERYKTNYPVKMFEYMAAELPVIASREGESAAFVTEGNCGILVDPLDHQEIGDAIAWLLNNPVEAEAMGQRGRKLVCEKYNWERESDMLRCAYAHVLHLHDQ